jgi:hypothetical protein
MGNAWACGADLLWMLLDYCRHSTVLRACMRCCMLRWPFFFCCPSVSFFSLPVLGYAGPTALFLSGDEDALFSAPTYSTSTSPLVLLLLHGASVEHLEREKVAAGICHLSHPTLCQFVRAGLHCDLCQVSRDSVCGRAVTTNRFLCNTFLFIDALTSLYVLTNTYTLRDMCRVVAALPPLLTVPSTFAFCSLAYYRMFVFCAYCIF